MKITKNGDQGGLARLAENAPGQAPAIESSGDFDDQIPAQPRPKGDDEFNRQMMIRDNEAVVEAIVAAGRKLGYNANAKVLQRVPDKNSHYVVFFSKNVKGTRAAAVGQSTSGDEALTLKFDIPSFGLVQGTYESGPDWIDPQKKLYLIRDVMKVAVDGGDIMALPMSQEINVNPVVVRQLGLSGNVPGGIHGRNP